MKKLKNTACAEARRKNKHTARQVVQKQERQQFKGNAATFVQAVRNMCGTTRNAWLS